MAVVGWDELYLVFHSSDELLAALYFLAFVLIFVVTLAGIAL